MKNILYLLLLLIIYSNIAIALDRNTSQQNKKHTLLSLEQAIQLAHENDPWLHANELKENAIKADSVAASILPNPQVTLSFANLPTNTWHFDQEPMTQFKVGISQRFPRGKTLAIEQAKLTQKSLQFILLNEKRKASLIVKVTELWLAIFLAQKTIELIERDKVLFEQMVDLTKARYSSAFSKTRQQDIIRSQLELTHLDKRLIVEQQKLETLHAQLGEWMYFYDKNNLFNFDQYTHYFILPKALPNIILEREDLLQDIALSRNKIVKILVNHPTLLIFDIEYSIAKKNVALSYEQYKPQWEMNASYAYRDDSPSAEKRADFFSIGLSFDIPLLTNIRQDKQVVASTKRAHIVKIEKRMQLKKMLSLIEKEKAKLNQLKSQKELYDKNLLKQVHEQTEALLTAYTNDDGDFTEVVRARIVELNTRLAAFEIDITILQTIAKINYFFTQSNQPLQAHQEKF